MLHRTQNCEDEKEGGVSGKPNKEAERFYRLVSELGYFLGTLKRHVPLTYRSWRDVPENLKTTLLNYVKQRYIIPKECEDWVMTSINSAWRGYKSRIKTAHYIAYPTDDERLEKRPENIPLEDFKLLLQYWGDEEIQGKESDGALFVKTRKRKANREYKTDGKVNKFIIDKIEKAMGPDLSGPTDGVDDLILKEKKHGPSWLIGRCGKSNKSSSSGPTNAQISDLSIKIRQDIIGEMEDNLKKVQEKVDAKVNKVHENLTLVLKKLGKANPGINIDLAQLCATRSSDNDNGTPITGGATS